MSPYASAGSKQNVHACVNVVCLHKQQCTSVLWRQSTEFLVNYLSAFVIRYSYVVPAEPLFTWWYHQSTLWAENVGIQTVATYDSD